jgi:hypothetical protein
MHAANLNWLQEQQEDLEWMDRFDAANTMPGA